MICPICKNQTGATDHSLGDFFDVKCPRCGPFRITRNQATSWSGKSLTPQQIAKASGWIREKKPTVIDSEVGEKLLKANLPSVMHRGENLLLRLAQLNKELGGWISVDLMSNPDLLGVTWSTRESEVKFLLQKYLCEQKGYIDFKFASPASNVMIMPHAFAYLDSLWSTNADSRIGFCAMWFSERLKTIWYNAIEPAISRAGYEPKIMYEHNDGHNNRIDDEMLALIRRSRFLVADFTHGDNGMRGGVYYEAGYAEGLGLPVICTCRKDMADENKIHFDNRQSNFILWEESKLEDLAKAIQMRIERTIGRGTISKPFHVQTEVLS